MKVIKTGTIIDSVVINTGLSSISFIMIYKKTLTKNGNIITIWHDTPGFSMAGTASFDTKTFTHTTAATYVSVLGGTFEFVSNFSTAVKPSSGIEYTWVAYGEE
jgi:hypothetical protein